MKLAKHKKKIIGILGVGYVGLPLAICLANKYSVKSFDASKERIDELKVGFDKNEEFKKKEIIQKNLFYTSSINDLSICNYFIIAVPTPIKKNFKPDLQYLKKANILVSKIIKKNDIIIYESTVYPGLTDEYCIPQIEKYSGLISNKDFYYGYSPERVNPGDKLKTISNIVKITSGSNKATSQKIDKLYKSVITAGTFNTTSIKVAESAKVIENIQRDINIALVNELSMIFAKMDIDCNEVIKAAATKWNFNKFTPGLVGGHCIGVDPYYLAYKSKQVGVNPKIILAGRHINNNYFKYLAKKIEKNKGKSVLIMGISFKENCKDLRNTQVVKIYEHLKKRKYKVDIYDPIVDKDEAKKIYNIRLVNKITKNKYDSVLIAVAHKTFFKQKKTIQSALKKNGKIVDLKNIFKKLL
jgi:UDP-N-acetyl-D-galactosamine dehydrogenase